MLRSRWLPFEVVGLLLTGYHTAYIGWTAASGVVESGR